MPMLPNGDIVNEARGVIARANLAHPATRRAVALRNSIAAAEARYGDVVKQARAAALKFADYPEFVRSILYADDPGEALFEWYQRTSGKTPR